MTEERFPACQGPDPKPNVPAFAVPTGTIDCHAHIFGLSNRYPFSPVRGYAPTEASLNDSLRLHRVLGGIERAVLTQPSVYGTDNTCMLDAVDNMNGKFKAVVAVDATATDRELEVLQERGGCNVRVKLAEKGGNPFEDMRGTQVHRASDGLGSAFGGVGPCQRF